MNESEDGERSGGTRWNLGLRDRITSVRDRLTPSQENEHKFAWSSEADTQALEEIPLIGSSFPFEREEPPQGEIDDWVRIYEESPIVRASIDKFARDVTSPGYRVDLIDWEKDPPPIRSDIADRLDPEFEGLTLDDALELFLSRSAVHAGEFEHDFSELLKTCVKDSRGRRGTALVEHVYDDASQAEFIMGFRAFRVETTTAYTRRGSGILLHPDDDAVEREGSIRDEARKAPKTPAGKRACFVQFDRVFYEGSEPEAAFGIDDVTKVAHDPDTGDVFGTPDTASIFDRAKALKQRLADVDHAVLAAAYRHWFVQVDAPQSQAEKLAKQIDPSNPTSISAVGHEISIDSVEGKVPSITETVRDDIEYILSGLPTPVYQIGFANDVNRDVTSEQSPAYRELVQNERRRHESAFNPVIQHLAEQFMPDGADVPTVELKIAPDGDLNPLDDEDFDATEFDELASALSSLSVKVDPEYILERWFGIDPDEALTDTDEAFGPMSEQDPAVQEQFQQMTEGVEGEDGSGDPEEESQDDQPIPSEEPEDESGDEDDEANGGTGG